MKKYFLILSAVCLFLGTGTLPAFADEVVDTTIEKIILNVVPRLGCESTLIIPSWLLIIP